MKKLFILTVVIFITLSAFAQAPEKMSYQVVIRNSNNELVTNHAIGMRISILQGSATGTVVYTETQTPTTNANGLVSIEIGGGAGFDAINWSAGTYFIKTETDPNGGTSYTITGTSQLLSVPYALYSKTASNGSLWSQSGSNIYYTSGNVGIGVSDPTYNLDVRGSNSDDEGVIQLGNSDLSHRMILFGGRQNDPNPFISWKQGDPLRFATDEGGWSEKMRITSNGLVGIGTSTPAYQLTVSTGNNIGIYGESTSSSTSATGIKGYVSTINGATYGVIGSSVSRQGTGVFGEATSTEGVTYGVVGRNAAIDGAGVYGYATSTSGIGYGVKGTVASPDGYSGYFTGGKFYVSGNVGIGTSTPTSKLEVAGQIKITGGTPAVGQILTSDGTGLATWEPPAGNSSHYIGESYGGGIVFYVYDNGQHGLIAATADHSTNIRWYGGSNTNTRARANGVGAGLKNTAIIIANQGPVDGNAFAATVCNEYSVTVGGVTYGDWYLPSTYELNLLYLQKSVVGGFADFPYWSSNEDFSNYAYYRNFSDGIPNYTFKSNAFYVRAVRAF